MSHLRGEVSRRARELATTAAQAEDLTQELLNRALAASIPLNSVGDGIDEPAELRRSDGSSMYEVSGSRLYTSQAVIDAEQSIVAAGTRSDGRRVPEETVEIALLESMTNGCRQSSAPRPPCTQGAERGAPSAGRRARGAERGARPATDSQQCAIPTPAARPSSIHTRTGYQFNNSSECSSNPSTEQEWKLLPFL